MNGENDEGCSNQGPDWGGCSDQQRIEAAREYLRDLLEGAVAPDGLSPTDDGRQQWIQTQASMIVTQEPVDWGDLVKEACLHPASFDVLSECAALLCARGNPIPSPLRAWASDRLRGLAERPRQHGTHPGALYLRDFWLIFAVECVAEFANLSPTRSDASTSRVSACDLVSEEAGKLGIHVDFQTLKRRWKERRGHSF